MRLRLPHLDFQKIAGAESTARVMKALSAKLDVSLTTSLAGMDALKESLLEQSARSHSHLLPGLPIWPNGVIALFKMLGVVDVKVAFADVRELIEVLAPTLFGDRRKDLLAFADLVEGRHISTFHASHEDRLLKEMPTAGKETVQNASKHVQRNRERGIADARSWWTGSRMLASRVRELLSIHGTPGMHYDDFQSSRYNRIEIKEEWMRHFK